MSQLGGANSPHHVMGLPPAAPPSGSSVSNPASPSHHDEPKKKRFHPLKAMRRMFRRKKYSRDDIESDDSASRKSRSTSELLNVDNEDSGSTSDRDGTGPYSTRLSMSHDSIFASENVSQEPEPIHGSSLSIQGIAMRGFKDELFNRVRSRRDSDEDMGLPHSPSTYPNTAEVIAQGLKSKSRKSRSTWSDGSLVSVGSSENDEDSMFSHLSSHHSSHASLLDRRAFTPDGDIDVTIPIPLSHEAAHHKIAVRPKKTRAAGINRRIQHVSAVSGNLPATPEVEELSSSSSAHRRDHTQTTVLEVTSQQQTVISSSKDLLQKSNNVSGEAYVPNSNIEIRFSETSDSVLHSESKSFGGHKSPRTLSFRSESSTTTSSPSPPVSRSKSTAAELKLQHEINQFSRRMAEKSTTADSNSNNETPDSVVNRHFVEKKTSIITKDEKHSTTEEVLRASWLVAVKDNSIQKNDHPTSTPESSKYTKVVKLSSRNKESFNSSAEVYESTPNKTSEEPFLSRLFSSRRSNRKVKKKEEDDKPPPTFDQDSKQALKKSSKKSFPNSSLQNEPVKISETNETKKKTKRKSGQHVSTITSSNESENNSIPVCRDIKLKPVQKKDKITNVKSEDSKENEFMMRFRKISESTEKRSSLLRPISGELIYQSNPNKGIEVTSVSNSLKSVGSSKESDLSFSDLTNIESEESQTVQFRILPAEDKSMPFNSEDDASLSSEGSISVSSQKHSKRPFDINNPIKEDTEKWEIKIKQKSVNNSETKSNDVKVTEVIDNNANITKVSISKHSCDKDVKRNVKSPLRETQSDISMEKPSEGSSAKLKSGKSSRRNSVEVSHQEKSKAGGNSTDSELFKIFAKFSQKQSVDANNDKENVEEKSLLIFDKELSVDTPKAKDNFKTVTYDNSLSDQQTPGNRPRSHTFPDSMPPVIVEIPKDKKNSESIKRSNSDKKTLTKQDSMSNSPDSSGDSTPPWLVLAQQRREQREKREKNIFGDQPSSFIIENASAKTNQRSSKVMDMVSSFQKLQVT
ncbi:hypothetical protein GQR58_009572 [Nymphon striatum]|nr:hypothetical protein GQR58_009572 [Nymphon striatum]